MSLLALLTSAPACASRRPPVAPRAAAPSLTEAQRASSLRAIAAARDARANAERVLAFARDDDDTAVRRAAIRALGLIGDPAVASALEYQLLDREAAVRSETAFSLSLQWGWSYPDDVERQAALARTEVALVEALEREADPIARAAELRALGQVGGDEALQVLSSELGRTTDAASRVAAPEAVVAAAESIGILGYRKAIPSMPAQTAEALVALLTAPDAALSRAAAYALFRMPPPPGDLAARLAAAIVAVAQNPAAPVETRLYATRALGTVRSDPTAAAAVALVSAPRGPEPPDPVRVAAIRALARIPTEVSAAALATVAADAAADPAWRSEALLALETLSSGAAEQARAHVPSLAVLLGDRDPEVRAAAAGFVATVAGEGGAPLLAAAAADADGWVRSAVAAGLGKTPGAAAHDALLARLAVEQHPSVRLALADAVGQRTEEDLVGPLLELLRGPDPTVAGVAAAGLSRRAGPAVAAALAQAYDAWSSLEGTEVRLAVVDALAERADAPKGFGDKALQDPDFLVRSHAAAAARKAGAGIPAAQAPLVPVDDALAGLLPASRVRVETGRGAFVIELLPSEAPTAVANFVSLVRRGAFDGLAFHRTVPDFVVQGGDPRGDGSGGPGYTIRCDYNPVPYTRGVVGMALSGKDTGGSQWFVTLTRQPHLDGHYTAFGRVVDGMEVAAALRRGDGMTRVVLLPGGGPP